MSPNIKVGVAGFSYPEWEGVVYPKAFKSAQRLARVAQMFDVVEINTSFYGPFRAASAREWCKAVADNAEFLFTAKLYRAFTHSPVAVMESTSAKTIRATEKDVSDVKAGLHLLAEQSRLGAVLAQFPISFHMTDENRAYLEKLATQFHEYPLVVEVRHASWNTPEILQWLAALGVGLCNIDQPLLGRAIRPGDAATSVVGYIRLHGRNYQNWFGETNVRDRYDYLYSLAELETWKTRAEVVAKKTEVTFVVANNHNFGKAAVNALELKQLLGEKDLRAPESLIAQFPALAKTTAPVDEI